MAAELQAKQPKNKVQFPLGWEIFLFSKASISSMMASSPSVHEQQGLFSWM
jgi:hypothetical protein